MNCEEVRNRIAQMSVDELRTVSDSHLEGCAYCRTYLQDMLHLSTGLSELVIPRPATLHPPVTTLPVRRTRVMTLMAATVAMLLMGVLAAVVYENYFAVEDASGPGTRDALFYTFGKDGAKKVKSPQTGQLAPGQSKPSPSVPSRN